jgi:hypothetical protein
MGMVRLLDLAASADPTNPIALFAQYGVLGLFAGFLLLFANGAIKRERDKGDQAQQQVDKLNEFIRVELLPKQIETALLHKQVAEVLEQAVQLITEMKIRQNIHRDNAP